MAKSRKPNKKKNQRTAPRPAKRTPAEVRLSQCMIVKNEEKNIERALSWAKDIAFEQIVVDTGSTDRTVEIAESMGAKVFHFEWIDDFSAAKNYAIKQASGNWIAFLDADEYLEDDGVRELERILREIESKPDGGKVLVLESPWLQVGNVGEVFLVYEQHRVFRNTPKIRYQNRIHENLTIESLSSVMLVPELKIYHTGYARAEMEEKQKAARNAKILREELEKYPDNLQLKGYLADALNADKSDPANAEEAERIYWEIADSGQPLVQLTARNTFDYLLGKAADKSDVDMIFDLCKRAEKYLPDVPDYAFEIGMFHYALKHYDEAWEAYRRCERIIENTPLLKNRMTPENLRKMMHDMAHAAIMREDFENALEYTGLTLVMDKYTADTLTALFLYMKITRDRGLTRDKDAVDYLRQYYDYNDPRDKLFLAKCAKAAGNDVLMILFWQLLTEEEKVALGEVGG